MNKISTKDTLFILLLIASLVVGYMYNLKYGAYLFAISLIFVDLSGIVKTLMTIGLEGILFILGFIILICSLIFNLNVYIVVLGFGMMMLSAFISKYVTDSYAKELRKYYK